MSIFLLPALLALAIKLTVLVVSRMSARQSKFFITMVLVMACHNIAEVLGYLEFFNGIEAGNILRWYYLMTIVGLATIVFYAIDVSELHSSQSKVLSITAGSIIAVTALLGGLIMFTNLIISGGSGSIGYAPVANQGPTYWLFSAFSVLCFAITIGYLIAGYRNAASHLAEIRCGYTLWALSPIIIVSLGLMVLMSFGLQVNAAAVMPIATALFLVITLKGEKAHGLTDIRRHIPFSLERRTSGDIMAIFSQYAQDDINYRDALNEIEKLLVLHKHAKHQGNVSSTAASMELPRSSLYSIFRRLEIELKESK